METENFIKEIDDTQKFTVEEIEKLFEDSLYNINIEDLIYFKMTRYSVENIRNVMLNIKTNKDDKKYLEFEEKKLKNCKEDILFDMLKSFKESSHKRVMELFKILNRRLNNNGKK